MHSTSIPFFNPRHTIGEISGSSVAEESWTETDWALDFPSRDGMSAIMMLLEGDSEEGDVESW